MTLEDLDYYIHLVDKAEAILRGLTPILKEVPYATGFFFTKEKKIYIYIYI